MDKNLLTKHIEAIGARVRFEPGSAGRGASRFSSRGIDVRQDKNGEHFLLNFPADLPVEVVDSEPNLRHLLLLVREGEEKQKYLLGHDERHWFVAAVPGKGVRSVATEAWNIGIRDGVQSFVIGHRSCSAALATRWLGRARSTRC